MADESTGGVVSAGSSGGSNSQGANGKSDRSRKQILDAAAALFRDSGYAATTLRQIAERADMKAGSIYYHFNSKDDILDAVLHIGQRAVFDAARAALAALPVDAPHRLRIETVIEGHLSALLEHDAYTSANIRIFGQLPKELKDRHRAERDQYAAFWDDLFGEAQRDGFLRADLQIEPLRAFVIGALNWTVEWYPARKGSPKVLADRVARLVLDGIVTKA